jgi:hypothetical protein
MVLVEEVSADIRRIQLVEGVVDNHYTEVAEEERRSRRVVEENEEDVLVVGSRSLAVVVAVDIRSRSAVVVDRRYIAGRESRT